MLHFLPDRYKRLYIFQLIILLTFLITGFLVFPLVLLTYILLYKTNRLLYKAIINQLCYFLWIHFTYIAEWWGGLRITVYADEEMLDRFGKEHALVLMNHKYDIDWITTWVFAERFGGLGGAQSISKSSLRYVPIIGWIWNFNGTIFLKRNWIKDKEIIADSLKDFSKTLAGYTNLLLLYPEGTRFTQNKLEASNEVARAKGLPEMKHCLLPRTRGFVEIVKNLRSQVDWVYDFTVAFPDSVNQTVTGVNTNQPALTMKNILNARVKEGNMTYKRISMKDLPEDDEKLAMWLQNAFKQKDDLFERYVNTGKFDGPSKLIEPTLTSLVIYCITFLVIWLVVGSGLGYVLWMSCWVIRSIIIGIFLTIIIIIQILMGVTQADKGSSYGMKKKSS